jgi:hypothetical protein
VADLRLMVPCTERHFVVLCGVAEIIFTTVGTIFQTNTDKCNSILTGKYKNLKKKATWLKWNIKYVN